MLKSPALIGLAAAVTVALAVAGCGGVSPGSGSAAAGAPTVFSTGDIVAGIGNGRWNHFSPQGQLLGTLNDGHIGTLVGFIPTAATTGACFDGSGNMYGVNFAANLLSEFSRSGSQMDSPVGTFDTSPESCLVVDGTTLYVSQVQGSGDIVKLGLDGTEQARYDVRRSDWIDLASDHCTMYYTDEGPVIHRHDVCTDKELPAFASPGGENFALRVLPDNSVLVAGNDAVRRFASNGSPLAQYTVALETRLFSLNLDPDGKHFWTASLNGTKIYELAIDPVGPPITSFDAQIASAGGTGLAGLALFGEPMASHPLLSTAVDEGLNPLIWLALAAAVVVILVALLLILRRRRGRRAQATN